MDNIAMMSPMMLASIVWLLGWSSSGGGIVYASSTTPSRQHQVFGVNQHYIYHRHHHLTTSASKPAFQRLPLSFSLLENFPRGGGGGGSDESVSSSSDDEGAIDDVLGAEDQAREAASAAVKENDDGDEFFEAVQEVEEENGAEDDEEGFFSANEGEAGEKTSISADNNMPGAGAAREVLDDPMLDEHSSANIDRMDYADAYDEEVEADAEEAEESTKQEESVETTPSLPTNEETAAPNGETNKKIHLATEITREMKEILIKQLHYRPAEVEYMRPEIAAVVVAKEMERPPEGPPPGWFLSKPPKNKAGSLKSIVLSVLAVAVAALGTTAAVSSSSSGTDFVWVPSSSSKGRKTPAALFETPSVLSQREAPEPEVPERPMPEPEPVVKEAVTPPPTAPPSSSSVLEHEHSLRPGERPPSEPIDETGLDKFLTGVEKSLGKLFGR